MRSSCVTSLAPFWLLPRWSPGHRQPTLPAHLAVAPEVSPLQPGSSRDIHPGAAYSRDKVMWVQSKLGWRGGHTSDTQHDAEGAQRQAWVLGRQTGPGRFTFSGYYFIAVEPGCCSDIFPGSRVLTYTLLNFGQEESR